MGFFASRKCFVPIEWKQVFFLWHQIWCKLDAKIDAIYGAIWPTYSNPILMPFGYDVVHDDAYAWKIEWKNIFACGINFDANLMQKLTLP